MPYAVIADVQALLAKFTISPTSSPTTTQATAIMTDVSNEIDAVLAGAGVSVPVTTPTYFLDYLGLLNSYGAAVLVAQAMLPDRSGAAEGSEALYTVWEQRYRAGLKRLASGEGIPPDAPRSSGRVQPSTYLTRNPDEEENLGDIAEPVFKMSDSY